MIRTDYKYMLELSLAHVGAAEVAANFVDRLYVGELTAIVDLLENYAPQVDGQDLVKLWSGLEVWRDRYDLTRRQNPGGSLPMNFVVGENVLDRKQLDDVRYRLDLAARTLMAQFSNIVHIWRGVFASNDEYHEFAAPFEKRMLVTFANGLNSNSYFGVGQPKYSDLGRVMFDLHDVIRNRLAWDDNPSGGWTVDFDKPRNWAMRNVEPVPLASITNLGRNGTVTEMERVS